MAPGEEATPSQTLTEIVMTTETINMNAEIYRLFSIMFYNPEETFLSEPETVKTLAELLSVADPDLRADAEKFVKSIEDADRQELILDYAALFVGPFQLQAPPYGSVYLDLSKTVNGQSTAAVIKIYQKFGLDVADDMKEPADHIAIELEFLHTASIAIGNMQTNGEDVSEYERELQIFKDKYFIPFTAAMCGLMSKNAATDFYRTLARLLTQYTAQVH